MKKLLSATYWLALTVIGIAAAGCAGVTGSGAAPDYQTIVANPDRTSEDRKTDERRKPVELLTFLGVKPGMKALDMGAGAGYSTELLARSVGPTGTVYAQNTKERPAFDERLKTPAMKNVVKVIRPFDDPVPPEAKGLDLVTMFYIYHDTTYLKVDRAQMNQRLFDALKPGGQFVLIDHAAKTGAGTSVGESLHRIEETALKSEVEAAGFKLLATADFLRHPADPRDAPFFKMDAPADEFVLKFVKP